MQATGQEVLDAVRGLQEAGELVFPWPLEKRLGRMLYQVRKESRLVERRLNKLTREYAEKDEKGAFVKGDAPGSFALRPGDLERYHALLEEVCDDVIHFPGLAPLRPDEFPAESLKSRPKWVADLGPFFAGNVDAEGILAPTDANPARPVQVER